MFRFPTFLTLGVIVCSQGWAQAEGETESDDVEFSATIDNGDPSSSQKRERDRLLQLLQKEVEPNLLKTDIDRLKRNVMRLGSYRKDWAQSGMDFLLANPTLAELYLYRFSILRNPRLNSKILDTLLAMPQLRYPTAPLAFAESLAVVSQDSRRLFKLLALGVQQNASLGPQYFRFVYETWGDRIPVEERLQFALNICGSFSQAAAEDNETLSQWIQEAQSLWGRVLAKELLACVRGA